VFCLPKADRSISDAGKVLQERSRIWGYFNSASRQAGNPQHGENEFGKGSPMLWVLFFRTLCVLVCKRAGDFNHIGFICSFVLRNKRTKNALFALGAPH